MSRTAVSISACRSRSTNAWASMAAITWAPWIAAPSWLTLAARPASAAASSGSPGATMAQPSMKICAPICSATTWPFVAIAPLAGAATPRLSRMNAVCSVELPMPPHHRIVRRSMM